MVSTQSKQWYQRRVSSGINAEYMGTVGSLNCEVSDATSSEITCLLEPGAAGTYDVNVVVKSRGIAEQPGSGQLTHTVVLEIFSNTPQLVAWERNLITVYGSGISCNS
eukprot:TRINITY_DN37903_c0_g1_i1.p1 TRINITY_DN37903_c0_g1~~TRINITY_DN37903_c0_g1_i1.p1  ORF type:complete len:108 (-),score=46.24 TRINITY_DN37903_c0_g1_i1:87-410(-)